MKQSSSTKNLKNKITVCICTYKRPQRLAALLSALTKQTTNDLFSYDIVVIDNDRYRSALKTVEEFINHYDIDITYDVEEKQNIALARNKSILHSNGEFIAFIDDDEIPSAEWLYKLYLAIRKYNADGILGPVCPLFEVQPPRWVTKGKFFDRPRHRTGHILSWKETRTGNALIGKNVFEKSSDWFRRAFGSGGEDRDFFKRKIAEGFNFIWCNEAIVYECIPAKRWSLNTQIKRAIIRGKASKGYSSNKVGSILKSQAAIICYGFSLPYLFLIAPFIGYETFVRYLISLFDHVGKLLAFLPIDLIREKYVLT